MIEPQTPTPPRLRDPNLDRVKMACAQLAEHFDSVQIFVTQHDPAHDQRIESGEWGCGNFMARYGQVRSWLIHQDEITKIRARNPE